MDIFRTRLTDAITRRFDIVPQREELAQAAVEEIMTLVRDAIEKAGVSASIDNWIVRTAMGKQGTRGNAIQIGDKRIETIDRFTEIYCRVYETERHCNIGPVEAAASAERVVTKLLEKGAFSGPQ